MRHATSVLARRFALVLPATALIALVAGRAFAQKLLFPTANPPPASEPVVEVAPDSPRAALATYFDLTRRGRYTGREPRHVQMAQRPFATGAGIVATILALQAATRVGAAAAEPVALTFLRRVLQFTDAQIAAVEAGQVVTRKLATADKPEIAVFGVVRVHTDKETFLEKLRDLESVRRGPSTLEIGRLSRPPRIEDLLGLFLDDADFEAARTAGRGTATSSCPGRPWRGSAARWTGRHPMPGRRPPRS